MNKQNNHVVIKYLEIINEVTDLCIDSESYKYLDQIIILNGQANAEITVLLKNNQNDKDEDEWEKVLERGFLEFPAKEICLPSDLIPTQLLPGQARTIHLDQHSDQASLLKRWSHIFWAKRLRAIILEKNNKGKWLNRYEDILLLLEKHFFEREDIAEKNAVKADYLRTKFNYLMELSAVARGEASFGYAERARDVLNELYTDHEDPERGPYDRWISWNKGTAYQHSGRNHKAALEFNWVIKTFWSQKPEKNPQKIKKILCSAQRNESTQYIDVVLEFLFNIVPAHLQRAAINLQLQLGYHALQILDGVDNLLVQILQNNHNNLFCHAAKHLQYRIDLLRIETLLQLECPKRACNFLRQAYRDIFPDDKWYLDKPYPPKYPSRNTAIQTRLVEHTITWLMERERAEICQDNCEAILSDLQKSYKKLPSSEFSDELKNKIKDLNQMACLFSTASESIKKRYWDWVKDNRFDEQIYFSSWAKFLGHGAGLIEKLRKLTEEDDSHNLLENTATRILKAIITLYCAHRDKLPGPLKEQKTCKQKYNNERLTIERFRSDDLPDFVSGLTAFYKEMSIICSRKKNKENKIRYYKIGKKIFKEQKITRPFFGLKDDHKRLLDAIDKFDKEFGENQQIKSLKRYNERLFWNKATAKECTGCLKERQNSELHNGDVDERQASYYFSELLSCHDSEGNKKEGRNDSQQTNRKDNDILKAKDYETIMQKAEKYLIKHLQSFSLQKPHQKALHFVGLQRWNSLTPAQGRSVGGGYLIYRTDKKGQVDLGIAIDPGFDFVRNLFRMGFSLRDIDIVIISHAHADHLWDFETMVQLLYELEGKEKITYKKITHRLNVIMTLGIYKRLSHIIKNPKLRSFINPLVVDIRKEIDQNFFHEIGKNDKYDFKFKKGENTQREICWQPILPLPGKQDKGEIEIRPTRAYHEDYTDISDSFGFVINIKSDSSDGNRALSFGYTGDTKWVDKDLYPSERDVASQYKHCDVLLFHLGSLIDHKKGNSFENYGKQERGKRQNDNCIKLIRKENHPYLMGTIRFLKKLGYPGNNSKTSPAKPNQMIFIGEFGEELRGGIRTDLVKRLQGEGPSGWPILPVDVGFDVLLRDYTSPKQSGQNNADESGDGFKFLCALCDEHRPIEEIDYFRFGQDEAIFHICKTCKKATPGDVRQTRFRQLYEIGRELLTLPDSTQ